MNRLLYVETSVWSRLADPPGILQARVSASFIRQACLRHRILISDAVLAELRDTPDPVRRQFLGDQVVAANARVAPTREPAERMAEELLRAGRWRDRRFVDMLHIAYTILEGADALVTWDEDDLARERPRKIVHAYTRARGLLTPLIGTPEEVTQWLGLKTGP